MDKQKTIQSIIEFCSQYIEIAEIQKQQLMQKLLKMQDKELALFLIYKTRQLFADKQNILQQIYTMIYQLVKLRIESKDKMLELYEEYCLNHIGDNLMSIKSNHQLIEHSLKQVCDLFNKNNVDYYIVGALALYLKCGKLKRYHDDIDFLVCENDLPKIKNILKNTDFCFCDNRLTNTKTLSADGGHTQGEHEVIAWHKTSEFHLGFFLFEKQNYCITNVSYFSEIKNNKKQIYKLKNIHSKQKSDFVYGDYFVQAFNTKFRTTLAEEIYLIKSSTKDFMHRFKDQIDVDYFEQNNLINKQNLQKLIELCNTEKTQNIIEKL